MIQRRKRILSACLVVIGLGAFLLMAGVGWAKSTTRLAVGGNGIGGVYYLYSGALSQMINKYIPDVEATVEVCAGSSVEHIKRMQTGEIQIAPAMNDAVYHSLKGEGQFKTVQDKIRTLFIMYPAVMQGADLADSGIRTFGDLVGKRVAIFTPGSGTYNMSLAVFKALGIDPKSMDIHLLNMTEGVNAIRNGKLDVQFTCMGYPAPWIMDLAATHKINLISATDQELEKVHQKYAYYPPSSIPAGTYPGVNYEAKMPGIWNSYIGSRDLSNDLVYQIVKMVNEHMDDLKKAYKDAGQATPANTMKYAIAPLHPGAIQYYKEKGIEIPGRLMPK
jgi:TRAP transporter TAXI family solute receptor